MESILNMDSILIGKNRVVLNKICSIERSYDENEECRYCVGLVSHHNIMILKGFTGYNKIEKFYNEGFLK